jgi:hypothetical protein
MKYDFAVRAGNSGTVKHEIGLEVVVKAGTPPAPVSLVGQELVFLVREAPERPVLLRKTSADGGIDVKPAEGRVLVPFSVADTRSLIEGAAPGVDRALTYELERRSGNAQRVVLFGTLTVIRGANDD